VRIYNTTYTGYIPVTIKSDNYSEKTYAKDGLFSLELDVEFSVPVNGQTW
jgi:hypothetical protein